HHHHHHLVPRGSKKNDGVTGIQGDTNQEDEIKENTGGLQTSWDQIKDKTIMNDYAVIGESGGDYYRNPVIVALGGANVLIVTEKRINYPGSANDIGVNGSKPVSIVYLLSSDAGDNFSSPLPIGGESTSADNAVSAPVVYYKKDKVYVIASAGAGISRTDQDYSARNPKSMLKYSVGTVTGADNKASIQWSEWKELSVSGKIGENVQFGTHSGRGIIASDGTTMVLPIITAEQGKNGAAKEMMGAEFYKVTANDTLTIGEKIGQTVKFAQGSGTSGFSKYKEAKPIAYDNTKVTYFAVPNPDGGDGKMGKGDSGAENNVTSTTIPGSEGSFGFLKLTGSWYGANQYDPSKYASNPSQAGGATGDQAGKDEVLFSHVTTPAGQNQMRLLDPQQYEPLSKSLQISKTSKSSSIDVLPDGTIIVVAEKERNTGASGLKFNIFFSRYTQSYLSSQLEYPYDVPDYA
uniref:Sialidase (Neuraminidase) family protein-like protein n=1 Tax=Brachyspira pilosicoli TaxID=52584 RepID=UPI0028FC33FD|nr:Chain A, Sialidase (Neuraminidase) family protein-like protein [Brachyspira pilosicoli]7ZAO_B Chain B, Sialidase (Neuraminidase) family protein-like protein [Brachyspira pilosicoli]